jgi:hypothetical protein
MDASSESTSEDCIIDQNSYLLDKTISGVSMTASGNLTVNTSQVIPLTSIGISVVVGHQTVTSNFSVEVIDCNLFVTFPYILP